MKLGAYPKATGICGVCGKPTKLLVHQSCHKSGTYAKSRAQRRRQRYGKGKLPPFTSS